MIRVAMFVLSLAGMSWVQIRYAPINTKKEWSVLISLLVLVAVVGTCLILNIDLPSPMSALRGVIEPIGRMILH
jgi:hypothetical protein